MHEEIKRAILDSIRAHERIILTRHLRPDGDAVGATMGLCRVLRRAFPDKRIWLANDDYAAARAEGDTAAMAELWAQGRDLTARKAEFPDLGAQALSAAYPGRCQSLTQVLSTTDARLSALTEKES